MDFNVLSTTEGHMKTRMLKMIVTFTVDNDNDNDVNMTMVMLK